METWYGTRGWSYENKFIEKVEVEKSTPDFIQIKGNNRKDAKRSGYRNYFPTFQEAKDYLLNKFQNEIEGYQIRVKEAEKNIALIKKEEE